MSDYYTIIPAQVRTDSSLSLLARLLYGDIAALASDSGECWASNTFFANEYRKDRTRVIAAIKELISAGYVRTEYRKPGNNGRVLIPCCENATTSCENATGSSENATDPLQKHNGTRRETRHIIIKRLIRMNTHAHLRNFGKRTPRSRIRPRHKKHLTSSGQTKPCLTKFLQRWSGKRGRQTGRRTAVGLSRSPAPT